MGAQTLQDYLGIDYPSRSKKPRREGITMVMDTGWPTSFVAGMLDQYGEHIDVVKIWDPHLRAPADEVKKKIEVYDAHKVKVQPGGIFMEIARLQGREKDVMTRLASLGFSVVEVSSTASTRAEMSVETDFVKRAKDQGFTVFGEVGKKFHATDETRKSEEEVNEEVTITEMRALLDAGADYVYWEGHLLRRVMGESAEELNRKRESGTQQAIRVAKAVGQGRIIFEVSPLRPLLSRRTLQFWLVSVFGTEVNLGNARLEELGYIEAVRAGSHPVHGFGEAGNYPWIRALESGKPEDYPWWSEALRQ